MRPIEAGRQGRAGRRVRPPQRAVALPALHDPDRRALRSQLRYLTEVDHHDHEALIAFDPAAGTRSAVARFVRLRRPSPRRGGGDGDRRVAGPRPGHGALTSCSPSGPGRRGSGRFTALLLAGNEQMHDVLASIGPATGALARGRHGRGRGRDPRARASATTWPGCCASPPAAPSSWRRRRGARARAERGSGRAANSEISSATRAGLVERHERLRVGDRLDPRVGDDRRQPFGVGELEEAVLGRPGESQRALEAAQLLGGLERVALVHTGGELARVALHPASLAVGASQSSISSGRDLVFGEQRIAARRRAPMPKGHRQQRHAAGDPRDRRHEVERKRREVLEGVAVGEHQAPDALGMRPRPASARPRRRESLPTSGDAARSRARRGSRRSAAAMPAGREVGSGFIAVLCEPIGQSGTMQRKRSPRRSATPSQRRPSTSRPWTKRIGSPVPGSR